MYIPVLWLIEVYQLNSSNRSCSHISNILAKPLCFMLCVVYDYFLEYIIMHVVSVCIFVYLQYKSSFPQKIIALQKRQLRLDQPRSSLTTRRVNMRNYNSKSDQQILTQRGLIINPGVSSSYSVYYQYIISCADFDTEFYNDADHEFLLRPTTVGCNY